METDETKKAMTKLLEEIAQAIERGELLTTSHWIYSSIQALLP